MSHSEQALGVRRATRADVPALTSSLVRAFHDDPVAMWACRPDRLRPGVLESFHGTRLRQLIRHEEVWMSAGGECAALWAPPEHGNLSLREDAALTRGLLHPRLLHRMPLVATGMLGIERHHPKRPHWYLAVLGTDPSAQGRGLGSAVLHPVLASCDADGVGAYLESSKERNVDFYARHGFQVTRELRLPRGPTMWAMWRDPRP